MIEQHLRDRLLDAQFEYAKASKASILVIATGLPAAGRTEALNKLRDWLDPKHVVISAWKRRDHDERALPWAARYWQALPRRAEVAFWYDGWYEDLLNALLDEGTHAKHVERVAGHIVALERMLIADGVRVLKWHFSIAPAHQRRRLKELARDPVMRWRVREFEGWSSKDHARFARAIARCRALTAHPGASWKIVDDPQRDKHFFRIVRFLTAAFAATERRQLPVRGWRAQAPRAAQMDKLKRAMSAPASKSDPPIEPLQARLAGDISRKRWRKRAAVIVLEGMDAAGKTGVAKRLVASLDARQYRIVPVSAPTAEESSFPYQWRFWRQLPELGSIRIFDRSWYGRVLVERVRKLAAPADWRRAYGEIVDFERMLSEHGTVVAKFWLALSKDEQARRFAARESSSLKRFKVDPEDWKNRELWDQYQRAAADMIALTDSPQAPWTIVAVDHKPTARASVLSSLCEQIEAALR